MSLTRTRTLECTLTIGAPVDAVWKALTDAAELARWFPPHARVKPGVGGHVWMSWDSPWDGELPIEAWEAQKHLRTAWPWTGGASEDGGPAHVAVDYHLEGKGGTTTLRLVHSGFGMGGAWDNEYEGVSTGWNFELRSLKHYLERHAGRDRRCVRASARAAIPREKAWAALLGPGGFEVSPEPSRLKEGDACVVRAPWGESFEARALIADSRQFAVVIPSLNDAMMRIELFPSPGTDAQAPTHEAWVWFSLWGVPEDRAASLERAAKTAMSRMLPA